MFHWDLHAKQWQHIEAPLRPSNSDIANIRSWMQKINNYEETFNVLILGVTPEIVEIPWPPNTHLFVIDINLNMIKNLLGKKKLPVYSLICVGNWLHLPFPDHFMHLIIGDGCYSMLPKKNYDRFSEEILRVLKSKAYLFMRFFIRPDLNETINQIQQEFLSGNISNFHILKWRIAMSLHHSLAEGVCLHNIWETWHHHFRNEMLHLKPVLWSKHTIDTIEVYKNSPHYYTFPTVAEISAQLIDKFKILTVHKPDYNLGECCLSYKLQSMPYQ